MNDLIVLINKIARKKFKRNSADIPLDYFSWGRDSRHLSGDAANLSGQQVKKYYIKGSSMMSLPCIFSNMSQRKKILQQIKSDYSCFDQSFQLMSDQYSRTLFAELILMKLINEEDLCLSSFSEGFIESYEDSSQEILNSKERLTVYNKVLSKVELNTPKVSFYTAPTVLNCHKNGRLYRYEHGDALIEVEAGDVIIDAGVGYGDTTVYLASLANQKLGGRSYAFDILVDGINALTEQCKLNPEIKNIDYELFALSDKDGELVNISSPSPAASVVSEETSVQVETITIDTYVMKNKLQKVDFIKMDIEGAEVPALNGANQTIKTFKPKLAISAYHKWDDLYKIPQLIHGIRNDYRYYLDCTTGFGGEAVLYCC